MSTSRNKQSGRAEARILKRQVIKERGYKCEVCGFTDHVDIHHIDDNRENNVRENVILLCPNCHSLTPSCRKPNEHSRILTAKYFHKILNRKYKYKYDDICD